MKLPDRVRNFDVARARFGDGADRWVSKLFESDRIADEALAALDAFPASQQGALFTQAARQEFRPVPGTPQPVARLFEQYAHVPAWVDEHRMKKGGAAFLRTGLWGGLALGCGSLALSYCSAGGNKPLVFTGRLLKDTSKRLSDTGRFVQTVSEPEALRPGRPGQMAILKVRLLHARVRRKAINDPRWHRDAWGIPINQADMSATTLLFSHVVAVSLRKMGVAFSSKEEDALVHLWRYAGYLMGVDPILLSSSVAEAKSWIDLIDLVDNGPDEDSRKLLDAMLSPAAFEAAIPNPQMARVVRGIYLTLARRLLGPTRANALGLPETALPEPVLSAMFETSLLGTRLLGTLPGWNPLLEKAGTAYWRHQASQ